MRESENEKLVNEFVAESFDHLDAIEPDLLVMEKEDGLISPEIINRIFRAVHTIKGSSGFFGFNAMMELSHAMESLLMKFRDGEILPDAHKIDALLMGVDKLRAMLNAPLESEDLGIGDELDRLKAFSEAGAPPSGEKSNNGTEAPSKGINCSSGQGNGKIKVRVEGTLGNAEFEVEKRSIPSLSGKYLYALWIHSDQDLKVKGCPPEEFFAHMKSLGLCIASDLEDIPVSDLEKEQEQGRMIHVLFVTILEPELMVEALGLPEEQILALEKGCLNAAMSEEDQASQDDKSPTTQSEPASEQKSPKTDRSAPKETIRVNVEHLDTLMNLAGELVLSRNQLRQMVADAVHQNPKLSTVTQNLDLVTSEIQEKILQVRMQPIGNLLTKFQRVVRDLSRHLSKEVEIVIEGKEVELDKSILEGLSDPLTHLIRNCVDHGIEPPEERVKLGKPREGKIHLKAFHEAGQVNITITDDGRGIDADKVAEKAVTCGFLEGDKAKKMSNGEKLNLVLLPGFSTAEAVTGISGRGVGMDVVKTNIENLAGHFDIESVLGKGTNVHIRLPLTLAIIPSLIVGAAKCRFAIPQINVAKLVCIKACDVSRMIEKVVSADVLRFRERLLPLVRLADILGLERTLIHPKTKEVMTDRRIKIADRSKERKASEKRGQTTKKRRERRKAATDRRQRRQGDIYVVVLRSGPNSFGLIVDELFDIEEIVVKPLLGHIKNCECFSGATIMGDGSTAMILDAPGIANFARIRFAEITSEQRRREEEKARKQKVLSGDRRSIIVFSNAPKEYFALPLSEVSRLEMIDSTMIEQIGKQEFITYMDEALPLIRLERFLPVSSIYQNAKELFIIVPKTGESRVGIIASRVLDIFESDVSIKKDECESRGLLGAAVVDGRLTLFLNMKEILALFTNGA